jgi:hypothetical protein
MPFAKELLWSAEMCAGGPPGAPSPRSSLFRVLPTTRAVLLCVAGLEARDHTR